MFLFVVSLTLTCCKTENACHNWDWEGCYELGVSEENNGNLEKAQEFFKLACKGGYQKSCSGAAELDLKKGRLEFRKGNLRAAKDYYRLACEANNYEGCHQLGFLEQEDKNPGVAREYLMLACNGQNAAACFKLGILEKGKPEAKEYLERACLSKESKACTALGFIEDENENFEEAKKYFKLGCDGKDRTSCTYFNVLTVEPHRKKSKSCARKSHVALRSLNRGQYSETPAIKEMRKACQAVCDLKDADSCHNLGLLEQMLRNVAAAKNYFQLACKYARLNSKDKYHKSCNWID